MTGKFRVAVAMAVVLAGCEVAPVETAAPAPAGEVVDRLDSRTAVENFVTVVERVEPVAEQICREQTRGANCDFQIAVDARRSLPPNAFQTLDRSGRPVVGLTIALIADARNQDELAFILGHETAHHVEGHLPRTQQTAAAGAIIAGTLAQIGGVNPDLVRTAQDIGATVGSRTFSKDFELEADSLGARIAVRAGYDPVRGARYFERLPDPGNRFLGSHPPNADRIETVARAVGR